MTDPAPQLAALQALIDEILGDVALGAYLHGSAVLGQLRPRSDTDVLTVARRRITDAERGAITKRVMAISGRRATAGPARSVELTIVVAGEVRPWRYPPRSDLQYGEWLRKDYEAGALAAAEQQAPDLAPMITMVLHGNRALFGPPPTELLDPVPRADLRHAIVAGIPGLVADLEADTTNVLLTFARIWTTLETGAIRAKDQAADWVIERLPAADQPPIRPPMERARDVYLGITPDGWDGLMPDARRLMEHLLTRIRDAQGA